MLERLKSLRKLWRKVSGSCTHCGEGLITIELVSSNRWEVARFCPGNHFLEVRSGKDPETIIRRSSSPEGIDEDSLKHLALIRGSTEIK